MITASPLSWPTGWPRAKERKGSRFGTWNKPPTVHAATKLILMNLKNMGADRKHTIISTDLRLRNDGFPYSSQKAPDDVGAAVYWKDENGADKVIALDQYDRVGCNLWAIAKSLEALRGIERWGGGQILERAFTGFTALPSPESAGTDPYEVLSITPDTSQEDRVAAYRTARSKAHPDKGGDAARFEAVEKAAKALGVCIR